jgi:predicted neutral ceramidase superfamily lipid hydrolase
VVVVIVIHLHADVIEPQVLEQQWVRLWQWQCQDLLQLLLQRVILLLALHLVVRVDSLLHGCRNSKNLGCDVLCFRICFVGHRLQEDNRYIP